MSKPATLYIAVSGRGDKDPTTLRLLKQLSRYEEALEFIREKSGPIGNAQTVARLALDDSDEARALLAVEVMR